MSPYTIISAKEAAARLDALLPAAKLHLAQSIVYSNFARFDKAAKAFHKRVYAARMATPSAIDLVWWPSFVIGWMKSTFRLSAGVPPCGGRATVDFIHPTAPSNSH